MGLENNLVPRNRTFREKFCAHFQCQDAEYEWMAIRKLLHRRAFPIALLLSKLKPDLFETDIMLVRQIGRVQDVTSLVSEASDLRSDYERSDDFGFLRSRLKIRLSGRRALQVGRKIWEK